MSSEIKLRSVGGLAAGQMEGDGRAVEVGLEVDLEENQPANGPAPDFPAPFAPAAETCARTTVAYPPMPLAT